MAAAAANERRRDKCDDTMYRGRPDGGGEVRALEEVHERVELVQHHEKARSLLGTLSLPRTELVICDFPGRGGGGDGRANLAG